MSLRKSPTRTPALLAANRANAQKSTGPRTPEGKIRVAPKALRHGFQAPSFFSHLAKSRRTREEFSGLYRALYAAFLPDEKGIDVLKRIVLHVWALKQEAMRWAASPKEREEWFAQTGRVCPAPTQFVIERPGWKVRVSVWVRWGRGLGGRYWYETGLGWKERRARLHVVVTLTASMGHPLLNCSRFEELPEGIAPRLVFRTEPEGVRKQRGSENVIAPSRIHGGAARVGPLLPGAGASWARLPRRVRHGVSGKTGATAFTEPVALAPDQDDPLSRHLASLPGDLLSWLDPKDVVTTGPRLSESEDIESWIDALVTRWRNSMALSRSSCLTRSQPGAVWRVLFQTKPEYVRKQKDNRNVITH
jgi:hypothetical protein